MACILSRSRKPIITYTSADLCVQNDGIPTLLLDEEDGDDNSISTSLNSPLLSGGANSSGRILSSNVMNADVLLRPHSMINVQFRPSLRSVLYKNIS